MKELESILKKLITSVPEIEAAAIVSMEGFPIASALPAGIDDAKISAMTAAILSLGEVAVQERNMGELELTFIEGEDGFIITRAAGKTAALTIATSSEITRGLIFLECKRTCEKIEEILKKRENQ
ncbi:MAG: roadblock/LC7 domain-containing protein [Candidatus Lokiarchaeota archaeon]|nr:roadblock/LC7 domain-containing protein [Candidatus Lokiarchaeota archaeon]MCK4282166.1 roadblock/LC7 domain-containing protein [Candidatus Lokiarchaeota archaeon]